MSINTSALQGRENPDAQHITSLQAEEEKTVPVSIQKILTVTKNNFLHESLNSIEIESLKGLP